VAVPRQPLSRWDLAAYGALALPLAALNLPLNVYVPTFYAREFGLDLAAIGVLLLVARLLDIVTDPLIGAWQDRTTSRFGRRRPWIAAGLPFLLIASFMLFVPQGQPGIGYLFVWVSAAYLAWTIMQLGYGAWGAELSQDYHERSAITGCREGFVIAGIITAAALPALLGVDPGSPEGMLALFVLMAAGVPLAAWPLLTRVRDPQVAAQPTMPFTQGIRLAFENRPFRQLIIAYLINGIANGLPATLFLLFVEHRLGAADLAGPLLLLYFASAIVAVPLWLRLSRWLGKHRAWSVAMLWACVFFAFVLFLGPGDVWPYAMVCLLAGAALGADLALPVSMQADVIDLDEARSGQRRTGLYFAAWSMATKLALALAVGLAFALLDLAGFRADAVNDEAALRALVGLYAVVPVAFKLLAVVIVWRFEIDANAQARLRRMVIKTYAKGARP